MEQLLNSVMSYLVRLFLIGTITCHLVPPMGATSIPVVAFSWIRNNTAFKNNEGGKLELQLRSNFDLYCPYDQPEYYKIYIVKEFYFNECYIPSNESYVPFLTCDEPSTLRHFTILITQHQPVMYLPDFKLGQNYYFMTTSSGTLQGINRTRDGACLNGMKLNVSIVNETSTSQNTTTASTPSSTRSKSTYTTQSTTQSTSSTSTSSSSTSPTFTTTKSSSTRTTSPDIPIIIATGTDGNTGVIDASGGVTFSISWTLLCLCLFLVQIGHRLVR